MQETELRVRISKNLMDRFRIIVLKNKLSSPKQVMELIRKFVEIHEENERKLAHLQKK